MGFHGFCLPLSLIVATHQLRTYSDPGSKCSIATNRSNPASAGSQVSAQFSTTPQSAHPSSPCARRAEAWPRRGWDGGWSVMGLWRSFFGGFEQLGGGVHHVLTKRRAEEASVFGFP